MKSICLLLFLSVTSILFAQPGFLDNSFGLNGVAFSPFVTQFSYGHALAIQPDGKILVTGHMEVVTNYKIFVVRYNSNGTFDPSFPNVVTAIGPGAEYARAIAVQPDGRIVVAGHVGGISSDFLVMRLTSSGAYDFTFGNGGIVITSFGAASTDETNALALQPDGKILIAGSTSQSNKNIALLRFNANGTADSTFGINGKVSTDINNTIQDARDIALQPDGKILVAGFTFSSLTGNDVAVFRYTGNGMLDSSFSADGIAVPGINADDDAALSMVLQPDGKIVTAGYTYTNFTYADNLIVRLDSTGNLDSGFNGTGIVVSNSNNSDNMSTGLVLQPDGKIVTTGRTFDQVNFDFLLSRFNVNGLVDSSFGNAGHVYTPIGIEDDYSFASLIQPDGKIVVTGYYTDSGIENFIVARYLNDATLSVEEYYNSNVLLYPQPATDFLHISLNKRTGNEITAGIYSITSKLIRTFCTGREFSIGTSELPEGIYILLITDEKNVQVAAKKFVVGGK